MGGYHPQPRIRLWVDRWALSGADAKVPWHGVLDTITIVWLLSNEPQQAGCPIRIGRLSAVVGRKHSVTIREASLMTGSMRRVWALRHQAGARYSAFELTRTKVTPARASNPPQNLNFNFHAWRHSPMVSMSLCSTPFTSCQSPLTCMIARSLALAYFLETVVGKSEV